MTIQPKHLSLQVESKKLEPEEFAFLAKVLEADPFDKLRYFGKTANFGLLFQAGARTFANTSLTNLKIKEAAEMVDFLDLRDLQKKAVASGKLTAAELGDQYFLDRYTIASYIRSEFRKSYEGLVQLANSRKKEASEKGYVRNEFGLVRRLPELLFAGKQDENFSSLSIAINSPIQGLEFIIATYFLGYRLWAWLKDNNKKSKIFNFTHDSCDMYIHKDEINEILSKAKELAEEMRPEYKGIRITISGVVSDYFGKGEIWKTGTNMNVYLPKKEVVERPKAILRKRGEK